MCVGMLNHDGLVVVAGVVIGLVGLAITVAAAWVIIALGFALGDVVDDEILHHGVLALGLPALASGRRR
jgi:hypothetical protein